ncbi:MAG: PPC domain-containing protein [Sedimentisphaerales bacterium]|nr:PPC domain-containing protein [Sedimentisphaerales bacterium]
MTRVTNRLRSSLVLCLTLFASVTSAQREPHIGYVYPAGGRQGDTFQVVVGGQYLDGVANASVTGDGVEAVVLKHVKPLTQRQASELRTKMQELQKERDDPNVTREIAEIRRELAAFRRRVNPAIAETVTVQVTVPPSAQPGARELRLVTPTGVSNPLVFEVGQLPELRETEGETDRAVVETNVTLPAIVNGRIMPGGVDRFRFQASKGTHLVATVAARELIPYLADAVPGWFQATLALYDRQGNELAYDDDFRFHPDPVLHFEIPEDGEYVVEVKDAIYRGREDFVYRLSVGELPFLTSIFPLGGPAGAKIVVETVGWNLPTASLTVETRGQDAGVQMVSMCKDGQVSNGVPFALDTLPEGLEFEPNNREDEAQAVTLPVIVNGCIDSPGDWDVFRFQGRAGERFVAEVLARRLDSPLDSLLRLTDAAGTQLAFNDDHNDKGSGLNTHHADSYLNVALPADGTYYVHLGDAQQKGGQAYAYRLRLGAPRPGFTLRVAPATVNARAAATVPLTVYALRQDGFSGDIALALKDAPDGFALSGGWVPAGQDEIRITLTVPPTPSPEPVALRLEGRASIEGREMVRIAVPAEDMMQAFAYRHLVPAQDLRVAVTGSARRGAVTGIVTDCPVKIPTGGAARVRIRFPISPRNARYEFEVPQPPTGIEIRHADPFPGGVELELAAQPFSAGSTPEGEGAPLKGNLIVNAFAIRNPAPQSDRPRANQRRAALGVLPAIPFEIVQP